MTNITPRGVKKICGTAESARTRLWADFFAFSIMFLAALIASKVLWEDKAYLAWLLFCIVMFPVQMFFWQDQQIGAINYSELLLGLIAFEALLLLEAAISALLQGVDFSALISNPDDFFLSLGRRGFRDEVLLIGAPVIVGGTIMRNAIFDLLEARKRNG